MSSGLQRFSRGGSAPAAPAGGGRFSGGGAAPRAAAPPARGGRFGAAKQQQAPEDEEPEEQEQEAPPARGGRFGGKQQQAPQQAQGSRFGRQAPQAQRTAAAARGRAPARAPGGRFTGLRSEVPQTPPLTEGDHEVEIIVTGERQSQRNGGGDNFCHVDVTVIDSNTLTPGDVKHLMFATTGNGAKRGQGRLMAMVRGLMGYETDEDFIADLPEYHVLIGAVCGEQDCEAQERPDSGEPWGENPLAGERAICHATLGQLRDNGDGTSTQFYNYEWEPIPQE